MVEPAVVDRWVVGPNRTKSSQKTNFIVQIMGNHFVENEKGLPLPFIPPQ
jgi:hypothetical protein